MSCCTRETDREERVTRSRRGTANRDDPSTTRNGGIESVHRAVGNQAVQRLHGRDDARPLIDVSDPGDPAEREAERVTDEVIGAADPSGVSRAHSQREATMRRSADASGSLSDDSPSEQAVGSLEGDGRPLPTAVRSYFEPRFGHDFGDVRVHVNAATDEAAGSIDARAFTVGRDIGFRRDEYDPATSDGKRLLAHELTHVVQNGGTRRSRGTRYVHRQPERGGARAKSTDSEEEQRDTGVQARSEYFGTRNGGPAASLYFETDSSRLDPTDLGVLQQIREDVEAILLNQDERSRLRDPLSVTIVGFADERGSRSYNEDLSMSRAETVEQQLKGLLSAGPTRTTSVEFVPRAGGIERSRTGDQAADDLSEHRRVDVYLSHSVPEPQEPSAPECDCPSTEPYNQTALEFVRSHSDVIEQAASSSSAPKHAVAAVIADEYGAQQRYYGLLDAAQDRVVGSLPESWIEVDQFLDFDYKLLNALENDIGPANFKVRTALENWRAEHGSTSSEPSDAEVSAIIDSLLTVKGTVDATVTMIERAESRFGEYVTEYPQPWAEAIYVSYFKQGEQYFVRFADARFEDESHQPCPGTAGCRFVDHREQITDALE
ncbi:eCIS core domain-containing protein [Halosimplex amylolyticum]|uniref:eCIS core domain-containing protein n=1 Tax=Halosimplex amylolyticum TaxID=3396616 RepID=UPI003F56D575